MRPRVPDRRSRQLRRDEPAATPRTGEERVMSRQERPACARCGETLGTYEPLQVIEAGVPRRTSLAAEPDLVVPRHGLRYLHATCAVVSPDALGDR
jgi:hypothetical protein